MILCTLVKSWQNIAAGVPYLIRRKALFQYIYFTKLSQLQGDATVTLRSPTIPRTNGKKIDLAAWFSKILL